MRPRSTTLEGYRTRAGETSPRDRLPGRPRDEGSMSPATTRCPACDEPIPEGTIAHRCPGWGGETTLALDGGGRDRIDGDPLGETTAYQGETTALDSSAGFGSSDEGHHGFPEVDDLIDRELGQYRLETVVGHGS